MFVDCTAGRTIPQEFEPCFRLCHFALSTIPNAPGHAHGRGGLFAGASTTFAFSWDTSSASLGEHTLTASHILSDDNGANNSKSATVSVLEVSSFSVESITPSSVAAGDPAVDVTVTGAGFEAGASLKLVNGSGPQLSVSNVVVVNSTTITATISSGSGGPKRDRVWDVQITNPDASSAVFTACSLPLGSRTWPMAPTWPR